MKLHFCVLRYSYIGFCLTAITFLTSRIDYGYQRSFSEFVVSYGLDVCQVVLAIAVDINVPQKKRMIFTVILLFIFLMNIIISTGYPYGPMLIAL